MPQSHDRFIDLIDAQIADRQAREGNRLFQAIMLAPTLEICRALLRGENVHRSDLNGDWLRRFGRKR